MSVTHLAGVKVEANGRLRQRCAWCGAVLFDYELANVAVAGMEPGEEWEGPATAEPGTWWQIDGNMGTAIEDELYDNGRVKIPADSCVLLDAEVTA